MSDPEEPRASRFDTVEEGFTFGFIFIVVGTIAGMIIAGLVFTEPYVVLVPLGYWGAFQLIYMIPAILLSRRLHRPMLTKGLILASAGAFLLYTGCFAILGIGAAILGG